MEKNKEIRPQKGKQELFLSSNADIVVYGGSSGSGKTQALLLDPIRGLNNPDYNAVIFRKEYSQLTKQGGLWDEAIALYSNIKNVSFSVGNRSFTFPNGAKVSFAGLGTDRDLEKWKGSQIGAIFFDELTEFTQKQFFYMLSRNRSKGMKPYIRATTNPCSKCWVRDLIDWWIGEDGLPIPERGGVIRYFVNYQDKIIFRDTKEELKREYPQLLPDNVEPKSFTFIPASIYDNKILLGQNPEYLASLLALPKFDRDQLLYGNWDAVQIKGDFFTRGMFEIVDLAPRGLKVVSCWDLAGTEPHKGNPDPDWTVRAKGGISKEGIIYILDIYRFRKNPDEVERRIRATAELDGKECAGTIPEDAGSAGKSYAQRLIKILAGYPYITKKVTGNKIVRATPTRALAGAGMIKLVRGAWNEDLIAELETFPMKGAGIHDDQIDAVSDVIDELTNKKNYNPFY